MTGVVIAVSLILWWRFLPLPHQDLNFYSEPAYLLAKFGTLTGPGSQNVDLTYQKGMYFYPPGHFLLLACWLKLFGLSSDSLLAYTHAVHAGILVFLWILLRFRYACSNLMCALVLLSIFPCIPHGRPDLPACLLSLAAWLALPERPDWKRVTLSGGLAGATLLVSAVDSLYFPRFYSSGRTLNYETIDMDYWTVYLAAMPAPLRNEFLSGLQQKPVEPSLLLVSAATVRRFGEPHHGNLPCLRPSAAALGRLHALGRSWNLPAQPYALFVRNFTAR